jgi:hypothetical protein
MTAFRILATIVSVLFVASAHAQPKKDIRGFYLGMNKADFLKNTQALGLNACSWKLDNNSLSNQRTPASPEVASWIGISCSNGDSYKMSFTLHLTSYARKLVTA